MFKKSALCFALVGALCLGGGLVGCKSKSDGPVKSTDGEHLQPAPTPLTPSSTPAIADVPMPVGFVQVNSTSRTMIGEGSRTIHHIYEGRASMKDMATYLRVNVGKFNWDRVVDKEGQTQSEFQFNKGREILFIKVQQKENFLEVDLNLTSKSFEGKREAHRLGF